MAQREVKFEETVRTTQRDGGGGGGGDGKGGGSRGGPPPPREKQDFAHKVGDALTQGAGPEGYLAVSDKSTAEQVEYCHTNARSHHSGT